MAAFLYFVEGHSTPVQIEHLRAWGLEYAFDEIPYHFHLKKGPPGAKPGTLMACSERLKPYQPKIFADKQVWKKVPGTDGGQNATAKTLWVGWYTAALPTCDDLARDEMLAGELVELCDGRKWQVPRVRQANHAGDSRSALPAYLDVDDDGKVCPGETVARYLWLWERCEPYWDAWYAATIAALERIAALAGDATEDDIAKASRYGINCPTLLADAVKVLSANYRIGVREAMALHLWQTDSGPRNVMDAACDTDLAMFYLQKKTFAATADT